MIDNELIENIISVSNKSQFIDKKLLYKIIINEIYNGDQITKNLFNDVEFCSIDWDFALACCIKETGIIKIDYDAIIDRYMNINILKKSHILYFNLTIVQLALHEIEHLRECYKLSSSSLESSLIHIGCCETIYKKHELDLKELYNKDPKIALNNYRNFFETYWNVIPSEKIAEADSCRTILNSINNFPDFSTKYLEIYKMLLKRYKQILLMGYSYNSEKNILEFPLKSYLKAMDFENLMHFINLKIENEYILLEDKFKYGIQVLDNEVRDLYSFDLNFNIKIKK